VLAPQSRKELRALGDRLKGAWVVHPRRERDQRLDERTRKRLDAAFAEAGVLGHIRSARDEKGELVHTGGNYRISWDDLPTEVDIQLRADQHEDLIERIEAGQEAELEFSIDNRFFRGPVEQHNVIADIVGTTWPDEYVIVGGHIDSWDGAEGAVDNGTGVATTMEAARLLMAAGAEPKRTIRFMLWSGEEQGLFGSRGYVERHRDTMAKTSAVLVHDAGTNYVSGIGVTPEMMEDMEKVFAPAMKLDREKPFSIVPIDSIRGGGSDHRPFIRAGVPGFFWQQSGESKYRCLHHTQLDTLEAIDDDYQRHSALVIAIGALGIANLDHLLDRTNSAPIERRSLGVELDDLTIERVEKDGKAKEAGLRAGDVLVEIAGKTVESRRDLYRAISSQDEPRVEVKVRRGRRTVAVVLDYSNDPAEKQRAERRAEREKRFGKEIYDAMEKAQAERRRYWSRGRDEPCLPEKKDGGGAARATAE
jgi:hypothetical protein